MSVRIACPACAKPLKVSEHLLGKRLRCPKCAQRIIAPTIGFSTLPNTRAYTLLCVSCSAVLRIDDRTVETPVQCSTCGTPVEFRDYPALAGFRDEVQREKTASKRAEKDARAAEREEARRAEQEKIEIAREKRERLKEELRAKLEFQRIQEAESAAATRAAERQQNAQRLSHGGGCIRCGSVRLCQIRVFTGLGKVLLVFGILNAIAGGLFIAAPFIFGAAALSTGAAAGTDPEGTVQIAALGTMLLAPGIIVGILACVAGLVLGLIAWLIRARDARCEECGWQWRT